MWSSWFWCLRGIHVVAFGYLWRFVEIVVSQSPASLLFWWRERGHFLLPPCFKRFFVQRAAFDVKVGRCAVEFARKRLEPPLVGARRKI